MKRILIVDDDMNVLRKTKELVRSLLEELQNHRIEIITATSGGEAFGIMSQSEVDLLITDYSMPDLNGLELIANLREKLEMRKVLLTFSELQIKDRMKLAAEGVDEILHKPVDERRLKDILERFL